MRMFCIYLLIICALFSFEGRFHTLVDTCAPAGRFNTLEDTVTTLGERHLAMRDVLQKSIENAAEVLAP